MVASQSNALAVYKIYRQTRGLPPFKDSVRESFCSLEFFQISFLLGGHFLLKNESPVSNEVLSCLVFLVTHLSTLEKLGLPNSHQAT